MRGMLVCCIVSALAACGQVSANPPDANTGPPDAGTVSCDSCDPHASCVDDACVCDAGYSGNGGTCADIDECAAGNGGCNTNARCDNTDGSRTCTCLPGWQGDGLTCNVVVDANHRACEPIDAEHPGYTNLARNVALCGGSYTSSNINSACHAGWHVCRVSEWTARYPTNRPYKTQPTDPDLIGPTIGHLASWGADQDARCGGSVWQSTQPNDANTWSGSVCFYPDDQPGNTDGADYNPFNSGKYLVADDGVTILQGQNADGSFDCCAWDVSFATTAQTTGFAVYCCLQ